MVSRLTMSSLNGASGAWGRGFGVNLPSSCRMSNPLVAKQGASSDSCLEPTKPSCHGSPPFVWPAVGHAFQSVQVAGPTGAMSAGATWSFAPTAKTVPVQAVYKGGGTTCCRPLSYEGLGTARSMRSFGHVGATDGPCYPGMGAGEEEIPTAFGREATMSSCFQVSGGLRRWDSLLCDKDSNINGSPQYLLQALAASLLAMASGSGRYALEAAAGPLDSASNLDQVQQARVREFREANRLLDDADFAFSFSTYEEAKLKGGDFLAAA